MPSPDTIQHGEKSMAGAKTEVQKARATIIVTPRERWGMAKEALLSIYANTDIPFELVYVDGRAPAWLSEWLDQESAKRGFRIIRRDRYVTPNEARNMGVAASDTEFVVFIDNDVVVAPNWLGQLAAAADETGVEIIAPLVCEGKPLHSRVHQATGTFTFDKEAFFAAPHGERQLEDVMTFHKELREKVQHEMKRAPTDTAEFHCLMIRRSLFEKIGPLDENLQATKEHIDFCMLAGQAGAKAIFEPNSVVTYVFPSRADPMTDDDTAYFLLRWSPKWQRQDLDYLKKKWGLNNGGELAEVTKPGYMRMRHYQGLLAPIVRKIPVVRKSYKLTQFAGWLMQQYLNAKVNRLDAEFRRQRAAEAAR